MSGIEHTFLLNIHEVKQTLVVRGISFIQLKSRLSFGFEVDLDARAVGKLPAVFVHSHQAYPVLLSTSDFHMFLEPQKMSNWLNNYFNCVEVFLVFGVEHFHSRLAYFFRKEDSSSLNMSNMFVLGEPFKEASASGCSHLPLISLQGLATKIYIFVLRQEDEICGMQDLYLLGDLYFFFLRYFLFVDLVSNVDLALDLIQEGEN